jgi:hypothetical protein
MAGDDEKERRGYSNKPEIGKSPMKTRAKFDRLLHAMATQPEPSGKPARDNQTSDKASGAGYGDTRTREGKSASAFAKPKRKSR